MIIIIIIEIINTGGVLKIIIMVAVTRHALAYY